MYGLLVNSNGHLLLSDEREYGQEFTKFPGGGLELGEGLRDGLIREYREECEIDIEVGEHIHTTDIYVPSAFNNSQVIAVYYRVRASETALKRIEGRARVFDFAESSVEERISQTEPQQLQAFRWVPITEMNEAQLTFEIDRMAWRQFANQLKRGY